jgi:hypothetical protein
MERRLASRGAFLAGGLTAGLVVLYLVQIMSQGAGFSTRAALVAGWLGASAVLLLVGAFTRSPRRRALLAGVGASILAPLAVAAMFSIGLLILVPALVGGGSASIAAYEGGIGPWGRAAAAVVLVGAAVGLLLLGFTLTA